MKDLDHRGNAIGGAGSVGDDAGFCGIILFLIDPKDDGNILIFGWRRDDDLLCPKGWLVQGILRHGPGFLERVLLPAPNLRSWVGEVVL